MKNGSIKVIDDHELIRNNAFLIMKKANNPIHCALSLVGEPIMYPHINEFVDYLHDKGISTYLVTNAQFPDAIATLPPITQVCHWQIA